jgi:hypothetical protein
MVAEPQVLEVGQQAPFTQVLPEGLQRTPQQVDGGQGKGAVKVECDGKSDSMFVLALVLPDR